VSTIIAVRPSTKLRGFTTIEVLVTIGVIAALLMLGSSVYRKARHAARVAVAENNLRQVATGLDLYFRRFLAYPPQGCDLATVLGPFVGDERAFTNPLTDEHRPGKTLRELYVRPHPSQVDSPHYYVTAFVSDDGSTAVVLKTGGIVEHHDGLRLPVDSPRQAAAALDLLWGRYREGGLPDDTADAGFDITDSNDVVTRVCSDVHMAALGSQFGYADGRLVDIKVTGQIGGGWFLPFGDAPCNGGETYRQESVGAGTPVTLRAEIVDPYTRSLWRRYGYPLAYTSNDSSGQVVVLRNGDEPISNKPGYSYQVGVGTLLAPYVGPNGRIAIADNEALYCFDFNPLRTRFGIDFNDLVILATATAAERPCEDN